MRIRAITITAAALLALTACSSPDDGGKDPGPAATTPTNTPAAKAKDDGAAALEASVRTYTKALFSGDGKTGYNLVSKRCQKEITAAEFQTMSKQGHNDYGSLKIKNISVDQMSGDLARVSYGVGVPQFEREAQPWTREGGTWRWDAC